MAQMLRLYCERLENVNFGCVKAPQIESRKRLNIALIFRRLRDSILGSFHAAQNSHFQAARSIIFTLFFCTQSLFATDLLSHHAQLLKVTSESWDAVQGQVQRFERTTPDDAWVPVGETMPSVLGKEGMAWGIGLVSLAETSAPSKVEGDRKAPAGLFALGPAFGFEPASYRLDYVELNTSIEAVDDPLSPYYNTLVDTRVIPRSWTSAEKMGEQPLYVLGLVVQHNWPNPEVGKGSAIFLHVWRNSQSGTFGCTALKKEDLETLLNWLDKEKHPVLLQLPQPVYAELRPLYGFP